MKIAIVGAGLCGLATAWHLAQHKEFSVSLFDSNPIGKSTSGMAAGLLHGFAGAHAKLNWRAEDGLKATSSLIRVAEEALNSPIAQLTGILRPVITEEQSNDFLLCAKTFPENVHWWNPEECLKRIPQIVPNPGIFVDQGYLVDCQKYLEGLWKACESLGVTFEIAQIDNLGQLNDFARIALTIGAGVIAMDETKHLPVKRTKGQVLELSPPALLAPLPFPINSQGYLLYNPFSKTYIAGATYERSYTDASPDPAFAQADILPKVQTMVPGCIFDKILDCRAGFRAVTPDHRPLLKQITSKCWILTGMGSKGLLYHALFAKELANSMAKGK